DMPRPWDPADATKLLTAITFAGLGGFWILFYSYWLRDKGSAMAVHNGRITGLISSRSETATVDGQLPEDTGANALRWHAWERYLRTDTLIGILGNLFTTLLTCLLAYALLFPKGLLPQGYELAVVQSEFFAVSWGEVGRVLFLIVAAAFLADTWLVTVDAVARIQADIVQVLFPAARGWSQRRWYFLFICLLTAVTCLTMLAEQPGELILVSAVIGFGGTVIFPAALYFLNYRLLPRHVPAWARPAPTTGWLLGASFAAYLALAVLYVRTLLQ
ncbi:MAG: Nramp family divalent metal transporter, partial [Chromatiales bacterium]